AERERHDLVIDCRGLAGAGGGGLDVVPGEVSKGEALELAVEGRAPDLVWQRTHAIAPLGYGRAWVGAPHSPGLIDATPTSAARAVLEGSVEMLLSDVAPASRPCNSIRTLGHG